MLKSLFLVVQIYKKEVLSLRTYSRGGGAQEIQPHSFEWQIIEILSNVFYFAKIVEKLSLCLVQILMTEVLPEVLWRVCTLCLSLDG